jgi:hypothetical protein
MVEGLSDLVAACGVHTTSPAERITEGERHWFIGYAAAAPAEMVALSQAETLKLVFRQEDVCEVRRYDERFLVRVRDGANMLVSFEQVTKAAPTCGCGDGRNEGSKQEAMAKGIDVTIGNFGDCSIRIECFSVNVPLLGPTRVCIPTGFWCTRETNGQLPD